MSIALALLVALGASSGAAFASPVPRGHLGKLPGFPHVRGVQPVLASEADVEARERLVKSAFAAARADGARTAGKTPVPNEVSFPACVVEEEAVRSFYTQEPCYRGGPVLRDPAIHLIFWQGHVHGSGREESVEAFPEGYVAAVEQYFANLARASGSITNDFAVDTEYFSEEAGLRVGGEYALRFKTKSEVHGSEEAFSYEDTSSAFPTHTTSVCPGPTVTKTGAEQSKVGPCVLDSDLHEEVERAATAQHWNIDSVTAASRQAGNVFVVITPPGVGGCFTSGSSECAYTAYCAYHSDFGGNGETVSGQTVYENLPYIGGVRGCELFKVRPTKFVGADAAIDTANHETNEAITDPLGSQCNEEGGEIIGCEPFSWMDEAGQEVADKCLPPETPYGEIYGEPLGTLNGGEEGSYNELIGSGHYWTQTMWSLAATVEGGCVQRILPTSFAEPANAAATVPTTFDGSQSGELSDPAVYWAWNFGDGQGAASGQPTVSHTYAKTGSYVVTLTAYDAYGNSYTFTRQIHVSAPPPTPPIVTTTTTTATATTTTVTTTAAALRYTRAEIAALLGLPGSGAKLSGLGSIFFGHAECPPACEVTLKLTAQVTRRAHGHRVTRWTPIGTAQIQGTPTGAVYVKAPGPGMRELLISLSSAGRALLRKHHRLTARLIVRVEEGSGASWAIERHLTLTSGAKSARHRSHAARRR